MIAINFFLSILTISKIYFKSSFLKQKMVKNTIDNKTFSVDVTKNKPFKLLYFFFKKRQVNFFILNFFNYKFNTILFIWSNQNSRGNSLKLKEIKSDLIYKIKNNQGQLFRFFNIDSFFKYRPFPFLNLKIKKIFQSFSFLKFLKTNNLLNSNIFFLRKIRVFNKGRYSRNRQFYRTGVYWCIYINIIAVIGIYFWFYKITINYNYLWLIIYIYLYSFIFSRFINFFSFSNIKTFLKWNSLLLNSFKQKSIQVKKIFFLKIKLFFLFF